MRQEKSVLSLSLILLVLVLLPFNSLPWFGEFFGELSGEGAFYAALLAVIVGSVSLISAKCTAIRSVNFVSVALIFFLLGSILFSFASATDIVDNYYKGRSGLNKLAKQLTVLFFCVIFTFISMKAFRTRYEQSFLDWVGISVVIPFLVGFVQVLGIFCKVDVAQELSIQIYNFISLPSDIFYWRVRGVSGEASWFGLWVIFVLPWLYVNYQAARKSKSTYCLLLIFLSYLLIFFSYSRTAILIGFIVTLVYVVIVKNATQVFFSARPFYILRTFGFSSLNVFIFLILFISYLSFQTDNIFSLDVDSTFGLSNLARFGSQYAAFNIGIDNIVFGVGLGQFGFHAPAYYPDFSLISDEIGIWSDSTAGTAWPPAHSLYARIFSELGLLGLFLWLVFLLSIFSTSLRAIRNATSVFEIRFWAAHFSSTLGVVLGGMSSDSFRFFGLWLLAAMAMAYRVEYSKSKIQTNVTK